MSPIQQMLLGAGAVATKTYVDDVFSTYVYEGDGNSSRNITNNIDLLTEGGLVWYKSRSAGKGHRLVDTERGVTKVIESNDNNAEAVEATGLKAFLTNGFTVGSDDTINESGGDQASWTFRKAPGFFDVVTWTGNSDTDQVVSHSLGSLPGMILYKPTSSAGAWWVYHREMTDTPNYAYAVLNTTAAAGTDSNQLHDVTSTTFKAVDLMGLNTNGETYVAYLFAGGESTAATARSVDFGGSSGDELSIASTSDFAFGTGDFTIEFWLKWETGGSTYPHILDMRDDGNDFGTTNRVVLLIRNPSKDFRFMLNGSFVLTSTNEIPRDTWNHFAVVRNSGTTSLYVNGVFNDSFSDSTNYGNAPAVIGQKPSDDNCFSGKISNLRIVKGTAVYTSSFRPPTEPLTNITNTKLLCCNNSSVTGSSVTPSTISSSGTVTASSNSPFDDPAGFAFGDSGDQGIIKCGSYVGNGSSTGPEINLGWEPQWLLIKQSDGTGDWTIFDSMRGIVTGGTENYLHPNSSDQETTGLERVDLTSTGFKLTDSGWINYDTKKYIFCALRRPDGYVGKPVELGTGVFAMDTGNSSSTVPCFDSGFPVDFLLQREFASQDSWITGSRHTGNTYMYTNASDAEAGGGGQGWDSNVGGGTSRGSSYQAWMWKRHAGFTVCAWEGDGVIGRQIAHDMNKIPEMIWLKKRTGTARNWPVYHKGLDGGSSPEEKVVWLNLTNAESDSLESWNNTAPTSTHFTIHGTANEPNTNTDGEDYIAMLFASVDGISKVGYYAGSNSEQTISCGFQPRFAIIRNISMTEDWGVYDTLRGWSSGNDKYLKLNDTPAQSTYDFGQPTSTGFTLVGNNTAINKAGNNFIFYAHA